MKYKNWIPSRLTGHNVHIVASGPSLTDFDYSYFDDKKVIAVNHSYKKLKSPLWTVAVDRGFVSAEDKDAPLRTTLLCREMAQYPQIIDFEFSDDLSMNPHDGIYHKKMSGAAAITSALHAGAKKIYIWGMDCCYVDGRSHSTDGEFAHRRTQEEIQRTDPRYKKSFNKLLADRINLFKPFPKDMIFNMSKHSAIPYFKKLDISEVI